MRTMIVVFCISHLGGCTGMRSHRAPASSASEAIQFVVIYIYDCTDGPNHPDVDQRAAFDSRTNTLIIYTGASIDSYYYRVDIPLSALNADSILLDERPLSGNRVTMHSAGGKAALRYHRQGALPENIAEYNYYLGFCWKREEEKQQFIASLRKAILLSSKL